MKALEFIGWLTVIWCVGYGFGWVLLAIAKLIGAAA